MGIEPGNIEDPTVLPSKAAANWDVERDRLDREGSRPRQGIFARDSIGKLGRGARSKRVSVDNLGALSRGSPKNNSHGMGATSGKNSSEKRPMIPRPINFSDCPGQSAHSERADQRPFITRANRVCLG
jgi:hypothetical protein